MRREILVRTISESEVVAIARCFRSDPEWKKKYNQGDTEYIIEKSVRSLAIEIPPSDKPRRLFAHHMDGIADGGAPLFILVLEEDGKVGETDIKKLGAAAD